MNTTTDRRYVSDTLLADRYDTSRVTIWRWAEVGNFPKPINIGDKSQAKAKCYRWRMEDVLAWESRNLEPEYNYTTEPAYLTDVELARRFSVSRITIWRWSGADKFPKPVRLADNCNRWRKSEVDAWEEKRVAVESSVINSEGVRK